ncbi:hypothetical protein V2J09_022569 [Rumex salicifolius]
MTLFISVVLIRGGKKNRTGTTKRKNPLPLQNPKPLDFQKPNEIPENSKFEWSIEYKAVFMAIPWLTSRNVGVSFPKWRSLALLLGFPPAHSHTFLISSPLLCSSRHNVQIRCFRDKRTLKGSIRTTRKAKDWKNALNEKDLSHTLWWKERLDAFRKPSAVQLIKRLVFSNLLGLDVNLRNGSLKEGTLNSEMLDFKSRFPREVLLCRVGDFYEAIGIDACVLVEYAGLNPFGGLRSDSVPRAGCPVVNLQQTLDDLTRNGYSVCVVEEVQGPTQARARKGRFISGHAHPGSPYVFGHVGVDHDLDFPEPMPVVGVSRSAKGYSIVLILETMKTFSSEEGLTEEALVTKIRTCHCHYLYLHASLRHNSSGISRQFEWFEGDPVTDVLIKVKELYGLDEEVTFRNVTIPCDKRPHSLNLGTATQIGAIPTEGIPSLLNVLLPSSCNGLAALYIRDLLLNPPAYAIASTIQEICKRMTGLSCSVPDFTCVSSAKLVKLLELREANHIDFCRIKNVADEVLQLYNNSELSEILKLLMDPTWVTECGWISNRIGEIICMDGEVNQDISSDPLIPSDLFGDIESSWKGRVKRRHMDKLYDEVEQAVRALHVAVSEDFLPIISRIRAITSSLGGPKGEILYSREHEAVWFKAKRFVPSVWAGTPGEQQIRNLKPSLDSKGRKVGEEWFTTPKVEEALTRYHEANDKARAEVLELLRSLSSELQSRINILVFASMLLIISKALFAHASEGRRRNWVFPDLVEFNSPENMDPLQPCVGMEISGLTPYWFDLVQDSAIRNTVNMNSLFLLTGPNGGGKSSLLRSVCAAALLGICGFMVPAGSASIPHFDAVILHMKSYDSPADGKSSFQIEMSEIRSLICGTSSRSLVLIDEICRGTETAKGTCIAGSIIESLDATGCLGIISTHLHGIFDLPLNTKRTVYKAMGTEYVNGQTVPTWELIDGVCRESLAFETAKKEGIPETIVRRAEEIYVAVYAKEILSGRKNNGTSIGLPIEVYSRESVMSVGQADMEIDLTNQLNILQKDIENAVKQICQKKLRELHNISDLSVSPEIRCVSVAAREQPPPSTVGVSSVYVMMRADKRIYIGQTDDLQGRVRSHRSKEGMQSAAFLYFLVPGKSLACQLETLLINQLPDRGFHLANVADGKHRNFGTSGLVLEGVSSIPS